jgi:PHD finger-like domain-containing protein 5A
LFGYGDCRGKHAIGKRQRVSYSNSSSAGAGCYGREDSRTVRTCCVAKNTSAGAVSTCLKSKNMIETKRRLPQTATWTWCLGVKKEQNGLAWGTCTDHSIPRARLFVLLTSTSTQPLHLHFELYPVHLLSYSAMSRHHPDLVMCRKQPGISIGRLCDKCDGKCPVCDSYVRPTTLVRICDECSFGNYQNKCVVCGGEGISDAFYCFECTRLEKDRDGCPKIINLGSSRTDLFYQKKSFRNQ